MHMAEENSNKRRKHLFWLDIKNKQKLRFEQIIIKNILITLYNIQETPFILRKSESNENFNELFMA